MQNLFWRNRWWMLAAVAAVVANTAWLARQALEQARAAFETDARIMHRLLSQQAVQHDAILATLAMLQAAGDAPERRLSALYPRILAVSRHDGRTPWNDPALAAAEQASRERHRATLSAADLATGHYQLVLAGEPSSFALMVDLRAMIPWEEWPLDRQARATQVSLQYAGRQFRIQEGAPPSHVGAAPWQLEFHKQLAAASQPFELVVTRRLGAAALPWGPMLAWALALCALFAAGAQIQRQRAERRRAEELVRLGQVARLNSLGELAAGMAHELNQPLTAVLAGAQAAQRLLDDDPPDLAQARAAMAQAATQARRAADVVGRLRRIVEPPATGQAVQRVELNTVARRALYLLEPECRRRGVTAQLQAEDTLTVQADPIALEQIVHNLLMNALQALEQASNGPPEIVLRVQRQGGAAQLVVSDNGPGIAPDVRPRLFEPFFSTRTGGLGLGLSLCETLAAPMGGTITADPTARAGATFVLNLPLAGAQP